MQVSELILIVALSMVTYRASRFIVLDTMFEGTRDRVFGWLLSRQRFFWHKLHELLGCPYCITVWVAGAVCLAYRWLVDPFPAPVIVWLATCAGALICWRIVDWEPEKDEDDGE